MGFCVQVAHNGLVAYMDAGQWALLVIGVLLTLFICEVLLRIGFEVSLLMVKLFENVAAIKADLEISRSEEGPRGRLLRGGPRRAQTPQGPPGAHARTRRRRLVAGGAGRAGLLGAPGRSRAHRRVALVRAGAPRGSRRRASGTPPSARR